MRRRREFLSQQPDGTNSDGTSPSLNASLKTDLEGVEDPDEWRKKIYTNDEKISLSLEYSDRLVRVYVCNCACPLSIHARVRLRPYQ